LFWGSCELDVRLGVAMLAALASLPTFAILRLPAVHHPHRLRPRHDPAACTAGGDEPHSRLILIRHGQSEWNLANRFTGWVDVDLTEQGISEAREAGRLLAAEGLLVDEVHTSCLRRAIRSAVLMLSTLNQCWVPIRKHLQLNEQHSGMLTGQNKRELAKEYGVDQVMAWRRKFDEAPPEIDAESVSQRGFEADLRYANDPVPRTESLATVSERVVPLWNATIVPALQAGRTVLVVTHGNTLRALVAHIDGITPDDVFYVDLPTATPLLYEFDAELRHVRQQGLWGERAARHGRYLVEESRVRAAQDAMRQQVLKNIAVVPLVLSPDATTGQASVVREAVTAKSAAKEVTEIDGEGYTVRQFGADGPPRPAYFFQESRRLEQQARDDYREFRLHRQFIKISDQKKRVRCALVLLRHGQSEYNRGKVFTGWADPDLTNRGREEARLAGQMLKATGVKRIEAVYTSLLKRAIKTAWLALDELEMTWTPVHHTWRLNERNYGELQGRVKSECAEEHGLKQAAAVERRHPRRHRRPKVRVGSGGRRGGVPASL